MPIENMIPKQIHYCWFGGNPLPKSAIKCIDSWRKFFPDYEIKEWNESNFDVNMMVFTQEAYNAQKYAFVSDVARFWILYHEGGLYFDTDVEVIKPFDDILRRGAFMGVETPAKEGFSVPTVAAGLGLGCQQGHPFYQEILQYYNSIHYCDESGVPYPLTVVGHITRLLELKGLRPTNQIQNVAEIWIYPKEYFCPFDDNTGKLQLTSQSHSIHWYSKSWIENYGPIRMWTARVIHRVFGVSSLSWLRKLLNKE